ITVRLSVPAAALPSIPAADIAVRPDALEPSCEAWNAIALNRQGRREPRIKRLEESPCQCRKPSNEDQNIQSRTRPNMVSLPTAPFSTCPRTSDITSSGDRYSGGSHARYPSRDRHQRRSSEKFEILHPRPRV